MNGEREYRSCAWPSKRQQAVNKNTIPTRSNDDSATTALSRANTHSDHALVGLRWRARIPLADGGETCEALRGMSWNFMKRAHTGGLQNGKSGKCANNPFGRSTFLNFLFFRLKHLHQSLCCGYSDLREQIGVRVGQDSVRCATGSQSVFSI